ncbi:hypothetical protein [Serratia sp. 14-2641]|uniref:hypothetical protein n=1 Tax=Serratia sp. 14-2641 TaxID=1841657 RepID=UPI00080FCD7D|nr:hypothetical protein [Serratia sp. 14-2641]OCJ22618.1 hypothetical protein A6U95_12555 [Serratia sp. 14-2641]
MSSLIFYTQPDLAVVATDTLAVDSNGRPAFYTNKAAYIPTLRMIIAGVGVAGFSSQWAEHVSSRMLLSGIENLDCHAQDGLLSLWDDFKNAEAIDPESSTTTVYHIGFSEETGDVTVFAYRSTNSFMSERLGYGTAVKPDCKIIDGNLMETIPSMMSEQRRLQESMPIESRIYIGGDIIAIMLTKDECRYFKLGEFPDREANFREMLFNL